MRMDDTPYSISGTRVGDALDVGVQPDIYRAVDSALNNEAFVDVALDVATVYASVSGAVAFISVAPGLAVGIMLGATLVFSYGIFSITITATKYGIKLFSSNPNAGQELDQFRRFKFVENMIMDYRKGDAWYPDNVMNDDHWNLGSDASEKEHHWYSDNVLNDDRWNLGSDASESVGHEIDFERNSCDSDHGGDSSERSQGSGVRIM